MGTWKWTCTIFSLCRESSLCGSQSTWKYTLHLCLAGLFPVLCGEPSLQGQVVKMDLYTLSICWVSLKMDLYTLSICWVSFWVFNWAGSSENLQSLHTASSSICCSALIELHWNIILCQILQDLALIATSMCGMSSHYLQPCCNYTLYLLSP